MKLKLLTMMPLVLRVDSTDIKSAAENKEVEIEKNKKTKLIMKQDIKSLENKVLKQIDLNKSIFSLEVKSDIIHRMIRFQLAKKRSGNHKTKGISEISGTTRKPFKQKGTGSARQGSRRSPQMRGGAVIFGPEVRSHSHGSQKN